MTKPFKTKITGAQRRQVMSQGATAAQRGWARRSPYTKCRAEEAWYAGYDKAVSDRKKLIHCTGCGLMLSETIEVCPRCDSTDLRPNVSTGTEIVMTVRK